MTDQVSCIPAHELSKSTTECSGEVQGTCGPMNEKPPHPSWTRVAEVHLK